MKATVSGTAPNQLRSVPSTSLWLKELERKTTMYAREHRIITPQARFAMPQEPSIPVVEDWEVL
jgi:hypothetical protein